MDDGININNPGNSIGNATNNNINPNVKSKKTDMLKASPTNLD